MLNRITISHSKNSPPQKSKFEDTYYALNRTKKNLFTQIFSIFLVPKSIEVCFFDKIELWKTQQILRKKVPHLIFLMFFECNFGLISSISKSLFLAHIQCNILQPTNSHHVFWFASHTKWKKIRAKCPVTFFFPFKVKNLISPFLANLLFLYMRVWKLKKRVMKCINV